MLVIIRFLLVFLFSLQLWANESSSSWYSIDAKQQVTINVDLFLSSTCPHCHKADEFFKEIEPKTPWLHVQRHFINQDKEALTLFSQFLAQQKVNDFAVPSIFFCNSRWLGFATAETSGADLMNALRYCKQQIEKKGTLPDASVDVIKRWANANMLNSSVTEQPTALNYLMTVVFLDALNPCALFSFLSLFALLFIQKSIKNQLTTGGLFILAIVAVHSLQQIQTNLFYQILPWYRVIAVLVGLSSLYLVYCYYKKQVLKPYQLFIWTFISSLTVYAYQQTCVMNWTFVFQQWLTNQHLAQGQQFVLQIVYQFFYVLPLIILFLCYFLYSSLKLSERIKPLLEQIGLVFLALTSVLVLVQPRLLSAYLVSYLVFVIALILGFIMRRYQAKKEIY